ncbi:MAG: phosphoribosylformylglycinamidine synthase subunit PurQ [Spirochaetota bacterium]
MNMVQTAIITGYGINADYELAQAFILAGAKADRIHIQELIEHPAILEGYHILAFPGGFSFGDHIGSGLVFAHLVKKYLKNQLDLFIKRGGLVIGVCNGFQVLVKMGILPNLSGGWQPETSLIHNDSGVFEDNWVTVSFNALSPCVWTKNLPEMDLPIRHGEGKFITASEDVRNKLRQKELIALVYKDHNPNGSELNIAGITDSSGRILGLMPHPEAFLYPQNHPRWSREAVAEGAGVKIFRNGVLFVEEKRC